MSNDVEDSKILTSQIEINPVFRESFIDWQGQLNGMIACFPGFISLEILSQGSAEECSWILTQRFDTFEHLVSWKESANRKELFSILTPLLSKRNSKISESISNTSDLKRGITQVIITEIEPNNEKPFREWMSKIHQVEAKFPGFRGIYVQSPQERTGRHWVTLLQFDTPENLDRWLNSAERQHILSESKSMITSLESHRIISPYAGWFTSIARTGESPAVWKQTMIVLLILFPIVMFELKYLSPLLKNYNSSFATFIGNAISVSLISWPMMPIAIWFLGWWLSPQEQHRMKINVQGTLLLFLLYAIEIGLLWKFL